MYIHNLKAFRHNINRTLLYDNYLTLWSNVKVTMTKVLYGTPHHVLMNIHFKYEGIRPLDKNVLHRKRFCLHTDDRRYFETTLGKVWSKNFGYPLYLFHFLYLEIALFIFIHKIYVMLKYYIFKLLNIPLLKSIIYFVYYKINKVNYLD
jgi:hypothetical protein